jgi:dynein axonemal heavy chain
MSQEWLESTVSNGLEIGVEHVQDLLKSAPESSIVQSFLNHAPQGTVLLFYIEREAQEAKQVHAAKHSEHIPTTSDTSNSQSSSPGPPAAEKENDTDADTADKQDCNKSSSADTGTATGFVHSKSFDALVDGKTQHVRLKVCQGQLPDNVQESRSMYVIKNTDDCVTEPDVGQCDDEDDNSGWARTAFLNGHMANFFEHGVLPGHQLVMLETVLKDVYLPMVDPDKDSSSHDDKARPTAAPSQMGAPSTVGFSSTVFEAKSMANSTAFNTGRNDFGGNMQKFLGHVSHAIQQVTGHIKLPIPDVSIDPNNLEAAAHDAAVVAKLRPSLASWIKLISNVLNAENLRNRTEGGPMSEIQFWRERNAALSALYEQLHIGYIKDMIRVMEYANVDMSGFEEHLKLLIAMYVEARDNVKFLTTLERHFKNISRGNLGSIIDTIPSMMNSLRMVWIISRHYNKDERMFPLMQLIAGEIATQVSKHVNTRTIFRRKPVDIMRTIQQAHQVLELWQNSYLRVRERIERSGTDHRWEFGRKELFDQTNYMARICADLYEVSETLDQFGKFLGNKLKAVTGDAYSIDEVMTRVRKLIKPIENLPFNAFDRRYTTSWDQVMRSFHDKVTKIEESTRSFIDTSFDKLRSAEGAFDLLQNFKNIESRQAIQEQMMEKFSNILLQYGREVEQVRKIFEAERDNPPCSKGQPPIAGAIAWARALYHRIKKPILKFQTMDGLLSSDEGKAVCKEYVNVAKQITKYEADLFNDWCSRASSIANARLKDFLLTRVWLETDEDGNVTEIPVVDGQKMPGSPTSGPKSADTKLTDQKDANLDDDATAADDDISVRDQDSSVVTPVQSGIRHAQSNATNISEASSNSIASGIGRSGVGLSGAGAGMSSRMMGRSMMGGASAAARRATRMQRKEEHRVAKERSRRLRQLQREKHQRIKVNFAPELVQLIAETKYLDRAGGLGALPEVVLNLALQEQKYYDLVERLNTMLRHYQLVLDRLSDTERILLSKRIEELRSVLEPGFGPLNWNSLAIPDFVDSCERGIQSFENKVDLVQKTAGSIDHAVSSIRTARLVNVEGFSGRSDVLAVEELHDSMEKHRTATLDELVRKYQNIGPLLIIIEKVVCDSDTRSAPDMAEYYAHWEKEVFNALTQMISVAMIDFHRLLSTRALNPNGGDSGGADGATPLIKVNANMNPPHIVVTPNIQDIYKFLSKVLKNIPESAKRFVRWLDGTCKECETIVISEDEEVLYTFWNDISKSQLVVKMMLNVTQYIQRVIHNVDRYVDSWKRYDRNYHLWNQKRLAALERLRQRQEDTAFYDTQLSMYAELASNVEQLPSEKDVAFVRISCFPLIVAIKKQAEVWSSRYAEILRESFESNLHALVDRMQQLRDRISRSTDTADELKFVLHNIGVIHESSMEMSLKFREVQEQYHTLSRYGALVRNDDVKLVTNIEESWMNLKVEARKRDLLLGPSKRKFKKQTSNQIETFHERTKAIRAEIEASAHHGTLAAESLDLDAGLQQLRERQTQLAKLRRERDQLVISQKLFGLEQANYHDLVALEQETAALNTLYSMYERQADAVKKWSAILWSELEVSTLSRGIEAFVQECKDIPADLQQRAEFSAIRKSVIGFKQSIPLIASLKSDAIRERHWKQIMERTGVEFQMDHKTFTLDSLFQMQLHRFEDLIEDITGTALQEAKIERDLSKLSESWSETKLPVGKYHGDDSKGFILKDCSDILLALEDNALSLQAMANSPFAQAFSSGIRKWERSLTHITETINVWLLVQRKWMYLEGIFIGSDDIRMQLPKAAKKFDEIDTQFKKIMLMTSKNALVTKCCGSETRLQELCALSAELDRCQKSLSDYLERKRNAFPRFFFISDDELLSILGSSDPSSVQIHMLKLFQNVKALHFQRENTVVGGMDANGPREGFSFRQPVSTEDKVEVWMSNVEAEMKRSLHQITKETVYHYAGANRLEWIRQNLGMTTIVGSQVWWTWEVEDVFRQVKKGNKHAMKQLAVKLGGQLNDLVASVRDQNLTSADRAKLNTLIIIDVHARDIVDRFVRDSILDAREFDWESQLRFAWDRDLDDIVIKQCTGEFGFGYEYMGLNGRLVITPLTDRCYMTLTQALTFHLGGSPAGPAGTGKTETVKDLAKALGLACIVTNCGEGLDFRAMGSIFSGLAQTGAWGCFDEFNRIDVEVLSVVSSQLQSIQNALNQNKPRFEMLGREISLVRSVGFFITMNPGYEGRTELPDNLKALFRPVTMIVPDMLQICEIMLLSEGFEEARTLAKKMTVLYRLAKEQLSKQCHYDFGLRALKAVLVMAGALKRGSPNLSEELVLMRALRDMNLPKFIFEDVPLFLGLIEDLFPSLDCPRVTQKSLKRAVVDDLTEHGFAHDDDEVFDAQIDKVIQLYETMLTRHTTMVVGPTGGGKSVVIETLARAQQKAFGVTTKLFPLNAKAITVSELYGTLDPITRDWTDGLLSNIFRSVNEPPRADHKEARYIVFDGDVDALWVENMNSVMDDNKLLTLPNGERIRLENHVKLLFEVGDLQHASPATISRCGMVFVDPKNLGYRPYFCRWLANRQREVKEVYGNYLRDAESSDQQKGQTSDDSKAGSKIETLQTLGSKRERQQAIEELERVNLEHEVLHGLFKKYIVPSIEFCLEGLVDGVADEDGALDFLIPITALSMMKQLCNLYTSIVPGLKERHRRAGGRNSQTSSSEQQEEEEENAFDDPDVIESVFIFCLAWSVGGCLTAPSRERFDAFAKSLSGRPTVATAGKSHLPQEPVYEYFFDIRDLKWQKWATKVEPYQAPVPFAFNKVLVPTVDTVRYTFFLEKMMSIRSPLLLVGESGTAKTVIVKKFLESMDKTKLASLNINFSSRTSSFDVQRVIEDNVEKRTGHIYGPAAGRSMAVFIDDLNMPTVDRYGTQQPIALLKYLLERDAMYDRSEPSAGGERLFKRIVRDLLYVGAMAPPGGGRNPVDPRFISLFNVVSVTFPTNDSLKRIYSSILSTHLENFGDSLQSLAPKLTDMTLELYSSVVERLPPTPSKFHYVFNLRDLSRVVEGVLLSTPEKFTTPVQLIRLWRNECMRVFHDRLISAEDRTIVRDAIIGFLVKDAFANESKTILTEPSVFGDFGNAVERQQGAIEPALYEDIGDYAAAKDTFTSLLANYNELKKGKGMNLVLFNDALEHLARIYRILRMPRGNALLVGVGGSGKQSLTRLAAFAAGMEVFQVSLTRSYGEAEFREDLKDLYRKIGYDKGGKPTVFLFTDAHVKDENFLEIINNMLTSGMVPALFPDDEKRPLLDAMRAELNQLGAPATDDACWRAFVEKCRNNLHIVLAMSPTGDTLRRRCRNFPGLINDVVIDWFFPWPSSALAEVADHFLEDEDLPAELREHIVAHMVRVHTSVIESSRQFEIELRRVNHVTPKNYLDYISTYRKQLQQKRKENHSQYQRLDGGLQKLIEAAEAVEACGEELAERKVIVDQKRAECHTMIEQITERSANAQAKSEMAVEKEAALEDDHKRIVVEKAEAEAALREAEPALAQAALALNALNKDDISEIRVMPTPPDAVLAVCQCVLELKPSGKEDPSQGWRGAKIMMSDPGFLQRLKTYPKDDIKSSMMKKIKKILTRKTDDVKQQLTIENLKRISKAGTGLLQWVNAIVNYYAVARDVAPRRNKVKQMERQMAQSQRDLRKIKEELKQLEAEVKELSDTYETKSQELTELQQQAEEMERHLNAASKLIGGLSSERVRWSADRENLLACEEQLIGDCLLAAAFLSYTGAFTFQYRQRLIHEEWEQDLLGRKVPLTQPFSLQALLTSEVEISRWIGEGLPSDELSIQNGILTTRSSRFPLCIDPQMQASKWIKERESRGAQKLEVKTFHDADFVRSLELAIQFGKPYVFESVGEEIDPIINPVLDREVVKGPVGPQVTLGDNTIDWNPLFRMYMITKLSNPRYSPEVAGRTMIINYTVTQQGLEDQLLNVVVGHEREDLQQQRESLVQTMSENRIMLVELENSILKELTESTGNILDNKTLIATLDKAKTRAVEISQQLEESKKTAAEIESVTSVYRRAAKRGAILFFSMSDLSSISSMYEFSLSTYLEVFKKALKDAPVDMTVDKRVTNIVDTLTKAVYDYVCTGIFEKHKLMYSFHMTTMIQEGQGSLDRAYLDFFLKGNISLDSIEREIPAEWVSAAGWKDLHRLAELESSHDPSAAAPSSDSKGADAASPDEAKDASEPPRVQISIANPCANLIDDLEGNLDEWKTWYDLERPEEAALPMGYGERLTALQQLNVLRCFRPDRVLNAVRNYVIKSMDTDYFVQPPVLQYRRIWEQSTATSPVVFVLSPGADPLSSLQQLAAAEGFFPQKFKYLALGQGQASIAEKMLEIGYHRGHWVVLQNCHLLASWLKTLEKLLDTMTKPHADFRLFLTTDPTPKFPLDILQRSLKVVTEPPDGLKLNMKGSYSKIDAQDLEDCEHWAYRPLVYVLAFFHAVVQERRKYGKLGWNVKYDFNDSDFNVSRRLLGMYLTKAHEHKDEMIPWNSLRFLIGEAMYGGRVTDAMDRRVLMTYLSEYMGDFLFDDYQPFFFSRHSFDYKIPEWGAMEVYKKMVETLPLDNSPQVFGLHPNAEIQYNTDAVRSIWTALINLQPRSNAGSSGISRDDYIKSVAEDILSRVPEPWDLQHVRRQLYEKQGRPDAFGPTTIVLLQELERWGLLVNKMRESLSDLLRALAGIVGMSNELDDLAESLLIGRLPAAWRRLAPQTRKGLADWMSHFEHRHQQYEVWIERGQDPVVMWLPGLHVPESYLTALVQTTCRLRKWPLDKSTLFTRVTEFKSADDIKEPPAEGEGCYISGLYLEGAAWDAEAGCLRPQDPKKLVMELPVLQVVPIEANRLKLQNTFKTPVYVTQNRCNAMGEGMVFEADLNTSEHQSHWILQGVALVLNTDE